MQWTNSTRAHNALLLDGEGQYPFSLLSRGQITAAEKTPFGGTITMEIPAAYPCGARWTRTVEMNGHTVTLWDHVEAEKPIAVSFPLHMLAAPAAEGEGVVLHRPGVRMTVTPDEAMGPAEISDRFAVDLNDGVPEEYRVTMPPQYHVLWTTKEKKTTHDLCFTLAVEPEE